MRSDLLELDRLAARLPFHPTDSARVNALFAQQGDQPDSKTHRVLALWTFIHVRRYFLMKYAYEPFCRPSDLDRLVADVFQRIDEKQHTIRQRDRYTHWVNVVCKNAYLSYLRRRRYFHSVEELRATYGFERSAEVPYEAQTDGADLRASVREAIQGLPAFLREPARLFLIEEYTYAEIAEVIGKGRPTVRVYISRALNLLRRHPDIVRFAE